MRLLHWALKEHREFVIKQVKAPLEAAIIFAASLIPEVTKENCKLPNTHILLDKREKFFKYSTNNSKKRLYEAAWKILIFESEHDIYYADRHSWLIEEIVNSEWKPRSPGHPNTCWEEPEPYGGGYLVKDKKLKSYKRRMDNLMEDN